MKIPALWGVGEGKVAQKAQMWGTQSKCDCPSLGLSRERYTVGTREGGVLSYVMCHPSEKGGGKMVLSASRHKI
jgi:hypothetical protein